MTIFQKILKGEIPCHKIYENKFVFAFLDVAPLSKGHTLLIPKEEKKFLHELSPESSAALGQALPIISKAIIETVGCQNYNILQNNGSTAMQSVSHVHFHIIPKYSKTDGLLVEWNPVSTEVQQSLALKINAKIENE